MIKAIMLALSLVQAAPLDVGLLTPGQAIRLYKSETQTNGKPNIRIDFCEPGNTNLARVYQCEKVSKTLVVSSDELRSLFIQSARNNQIEVPGINSDDYEIANSVNQNVSLDNLAAMKEKKAKLDKELDYHAASLGKQDSGYAILKSQVSMMGLRIDYAERVLTQQAHARDAEDKITNALKVYAEPLFQSILKEGSMLAMSGSKSSDYYHADYVNLLSAVQLLLKKYKTANKAVLTGKMALMNNGDSLDIDSCQINKVDGGYTVYSNSRQVSVMYTDGVRAVGVIKTIYKDYSDLRVIFAKDSSAALAGLDYLISRAYCD